MKRRNFFKKTIKSTALGGLAVSGLFFPNIVNSKKRYTWVAVSAFDKAGILGRAFSRLCDEITRISNGELNIKLFHANELVGAFESFDVVQSGTCQMGFGSPYYWTGKSPAITFLSGIPFGFNQQEMSAWFYHGDGMKLANEVYNNLNLKFFPAGNTGNQMGGWFNKSIKDVIDFKGLKFRMPGLGGEVLKSYGTNVVLLPGPDVVPAITSGTIDGTEWIGPAADLGKGLHKVCKYYYYPGWHEPGTCLEAFINLEAWNKLGKSLQRLVEACCIKSNSYIASEFFARNCFAMRKLKDKYKVSFVRYEDSVLKLLKIRSDEIVSNIASKDKLSKKIFDNILSFRELAIFWSHYSEADYLNARILSD
jgi:TRAP-type mannitol/chloroaromatic compound transport system substrate-binding protein